MRFTAALTLSALLAGLTPAALAVDAPNPLFVIKQTITSGEGANDNKEAHEAFLKRHTDNGTILMSGKLPTVKGGGLLVIQAKNLDAAKAVIGADPFTQNGIADYEITEYRPRTVSPDIQKYANQGGKR